MTEFSQGHTHMRPRQTAFNARTLQGPTGDNATGESILEELTVSFEELNQANDWRVRAERRDIKVATEINEHGHVLGAGETVSMEGVQIHLNSSQVDQIIAFLKKWVPIILKKIKDLAKQFMAWVNSITAAVDGKIKKAQDYLRGHKSHKSFDVVLNGAGIPARAAANMINRMDTRHFQPRTVAGYGQLIKRFEEARTQGLDVSNTTRMCDLYLMSRQSWIMMGGDVPSGLTSVSEVLAGTEAPTRAMMGDAFKQNLGAAGTGPVTVKGQVGQLMKLLEETQDLQLKLNFEVRTLLNELAKVTDRLDEVNDSKSAEDYTDEDKLSLVGMKSLIGLTSRVSGDLSVGLQFRLKVLGEVASFANSCLDEVN